MLLGLETSPNRSSDTWRLLPCQLGGRQCGRGWSAREGSRDLSSPSHPELSSNPRHRWPLWFRISMSSNCSGKSLGLDCREKLLRVFSFRVPLSGWLQKEPRPILAAPYLETGESPSGFGTYTAANGKVVYEAGIRLLELRNFRLIRTIRV